MKLMNKLIIMGLLVSPLPLLATKLHFDQNNLLQQPTVSQSTVLIPTSPAVTNLSNTLTIKLATTKNNNPHQWLNRNQVTKILQNATRSGQLPFVLSEIKAMQLPKSLALIPIIESHYHSNAVSGKGAGGIWQLMPATAKQFGVKGRQRFQLAPSTIAALKYFKQLHHQFGNWNLAVAAYNAGNGRVEQALRHSPNVTRVADLKLPSETKQYVNRFNQLQNYIGETTA